MFGFIKKCFFTGLAFLSTSTSINLLSCISMNNQECKVRPQVFSLNRDEHVLFPFSIKRSKCNGSCNNINNPYAKLCVPYVVKNLNVNPIQDGHFRDCSQMGGPKRSPLPKICHTFSTVIPYLKKIQKIYESLDTLPYFCWEISKFCYIKKCRYRLHFRT